MLKWSGCSGRPARRRFTGDGTGTGKPAARALLPRHPAVSVVVSAGVAEGEQGPASLQGRSDRGIARVEPAGATVKAGDVDAVLLEAGEEGLPLGGPVGRRRAVAPVGAVAPA